MVEVKIEQGKAAKDAVGDVDTAQAGEMASFFTTPVAGGKATKVIYGVTMMVCLGLFVFSLYSAAPAWAEPVASVQTVQEDELPFPDVYMCFTAEFVKLFVDDGLTAKYRKSMKDCNGLTSVPDLSQVGKDSATSCLVSDVEAAFAFDMETEEADGSDGSVAVSANQKAKQLADLMPQGSGGYEPNCYAYPANGAKIKSADAGTIAYLMFEFEPNYDEAGFDFDEVMSNGQYTTMYMVEPGAEVVKDGKPAVSGTFFPAFGTIALASMSVDLVKDEIAGDTDFHYVYRASATPVLASASKYHEASGTAYSSDSYGMVSAFKFFSFTVNKIHVRRITFGEIWAQIGGMWGASIFVMSLMFGASGYIRKSDNKELLVLRFQSLKSKKEAIKAAGGIAKDEEEVANGLAKLKERLAALESVVHQN